MLKIYFPVFAFICLTGSVTTAQAPSFVWAKQGVTAPFGADASAFLVTDTAGNSYVGGYFESDTMRFGNFTLTQPNVNFNCLYLVKYDTQGNVVWAEQTQGMLESQCTALALNPATGKLYIVAWYDLQTGSATFGSYTFSAGTNDCFLAQLDPATGNVDWVSTMLGSDNWVEIYADAIAVSGAIYVTGTYEFYGSGYMGSLILGNGITLDAPGYDFNNIFLAQYDFNGNAQWGRLGYGDYSSVASTALVTDKAGNPYIAGDYYNNFEIGPDSLSFGTHSFYLAKYDTSGNFLWIQSTSSENTNGNGYNAVTGMAKDGNDNIYVTGYFVDTIFFVPYDTIPITNGTGNYQDFVAKYDGNGHTLWVKNYEANWSSTLQAPAIAVDADNNFYLAGGYFYPLRLGPDSLTPYGDIGNDNIFIAKCDSMGNVLWAKSAGGDCCDYGMGIGLDAHGNEYISGYFHSDTTYYDSITLYTRGGWDVLIAKLGIGTEAVNFTASDTIVCSGDSVNFINLSSGLPSTDLDWTFSGGIPATSAASNPTVVYNDSGTYPVKLVVNNSGGTDSLTKTGYITVLPSPAPVVTATDSLICSGDSAQVCASGGSTYVWNTSATSSCTYASAAGGYWVTATGADGCTAVSGHQNISVYPVPSVSITVQGDTLSSFAAVSYQWYLNGDSIPNANNSMHIASQTGNYSVEVTDTNGCRALSGNTRVVITGIAQLNENAGLNIYPNPFTNSVFIQANNDIEGIEIYDLTGRIIVSNNYRLPGNATVLELSYLSKGFYYIKIKANDKYYYEPIIKQ